MAKLTQPPSLNPRWQADIGDHVIGLAWSPRGDTLAAASVSGPIALLDASTGSLRHSFAGHGFGTTSLSWQPKGHLLASCGQDGKVRLWDSANATAVAALDGGAAWMERVCWSPDGKRLASIGGKKLRLWTAAGELLRAYPDQPSSMADLAWSLKGKRLFTAGYGGAALWATDADEPVRRFNWKGSVIAVAPSPDGKYIAGGGQDATVHFWIVRSGKDLEMSGYPQKVLELAWDSSSTYLATGGGEQITVWNCSGNGPAESTPIMFAVHDQPLTCLAFQHRGPLLASSSADGVLALTCPGVSRKWLAQIQLGTGIARIAWAPNDARLALGGETGSVGVWAV